MKTLSFMSLIGCIAAVGCTAPQGSARYVLKDADHGVIALPADNELNRAKAKELMATHFPDGYVLGKEWEEEIGVDTNFAESSRERIRQVGNTEADDETSAIPNFFRQSGRTTGIQSTRKAKEWRIEYVRLKDPSANAFSGRGDARTSESVLSDQQADPVQQNELDQFGAGQNAVVPAQHTDVPTQQPIFPESSFVPAKQAALPQDLPQSQPEPQPEPQPQPEPPGEVNPFESLSRDQFEGGF